MIVLDTNIIIYYLAQDSDIVLKINAFLEQGKTIIIPTIVRLELFSKKTLSTQEHSVAMKFLNLVRQQDLNIPIADIAARLRRKYSVKTPDSIIAATAIHFSAPLVTNNTRDFRRIDGLQLAE